MGNALARQMGVPWEEVEEAIAAETVRIVREYRETVYESLRRVGHDVVATDRGGACPPASERASISSQSPPVRL